MSESEGVVIMPISNNTEYAESVKTYFTLCDSIKKKKDDLKATNEEINEEIKDEESDKKIEKERIIQYMIETKNKLNYHGQTYGIKETTKVPKVDLDKIHNAYENFLEDRNLSDTELSKSSEEFRTFLEEEFGKPKTLYDLKKLPKEKGTKRKRNETDENDE